MKKFYYLVLYQVSSTLLILLLLSYLGVSKQQIFILILPIQLANSQIWARLSQTSSRKIVVSFLSMGFLATDIYQLFPIPSEMWRIALIAISFLLFLILYMISILSLAKNTD